MITETTRGVFVIAATPFTGAGEVDFPSIDRMVDYYLQRGADGLTVLGVMGEAPKLTQVEAIAVVKATLARMNGRPVIVGVSAPGLAAIGELTRAVMDMGAAGVMVAPPGSLKTDDQIFTYYQNVVDAIGANVPVVLQDFPLVTGIHISSSLLGRIIETTDAVAHDPVLVHRLRRVRDARLRAAGARAGVLPGVSR